MSRNGWECTLEIIRIITDIDDANSELSGTDNLDRRKMLSDRIDALEGNLFELQNKLKKIDII